MLHSIFYGMEDQCVSPYPGIQTEVLRLLLKFMVMGRYPHKTSPSSYESVLASYNSLCLHRQAAREEEKRRIRRERRKGVKAGRQRQEQEGDGSESESKNKNKYKC